MSGRWLRGLAVIAVAVLWAVAALPVLGADPSPSVPSLAHETLITTNARVGEELVWWGLRLLIACFAGLAIVGATSFIRGLLKPKPTAAELAAGGFGLTDLLAATLKMIPDLIKTPAGIAGLILILGVLMLLGTAAIDTGQLTDTPAASPAATEPSVGPGGTMTSPSEMPPSPAAFAAPSLRGAI